MSRASWIVLAVVLLAIAGLSSSWVAAWYGMAFAALVIYAIAAFRRPARLLSSSRRLSASHLELGEEMTVWVGLSWEGLRGGGWVLARDQPPPALEIRDPPGRLFVSGPGQTLTLTYRVVGSRRGYHPVGPISLACGDFFGATRIETQQQRVDHVTVYPKVVAIPRVRLPSNRPIGDVPAGNRTFEDPTRLVGVRDYVPGDSLSRIHWRTAARTGRMASKVYEPSSSTEVNMVLNLSADDYESELEVELACTAAASLAVGLLQDRQAVGLQSNGHDARRDATDASLDEGLRPDKGRSQLVKVLSLIGCLEASQGVALPDFLTRIHSQLAWTATVLVITNGLDVPAAQALQDLRRSGFAVAAVIVGDGQYGHTAVQRAAPLNIPMARVRKEEELAALEFRRPGRR